MSSSLLESVLASSPSPSLCSTSMASLPYLLAYEPICAYTLLQKDNLSEKQIAKNYIKKHNIQISVIPINDIIINNIFYCRLTHWNQENKSEDVWTKFIKRYRNFKRKNIDINIAEGEFQDISEFKRTLSPTEEQTYSKIKVPSSVKVTPSEMKQLYERYKQDKRSRKCMSRKTSPSPSGSIGVGGKAGERGL